MTRGTEIGRVLFLTHVYPRSADDSVAPFLSDLARRLTDAGAEVHVLVPHAPGLAARDERPEGVSVRRFRYGSDRSETLAYRGEMHHLARQLPWGPLRFAKLCLSFLQAARTTIAELEPQVLHAHWWLPGGLVGVLASWMTGVPLVLTSHGTDVYLLRQKRAFLPLARWVFRRADAVTGISADVLGVLTGELGVERERTFRTPMPVNAELFQPAPPPAGEDFRILAVGRLIERKGHRFLLEAVKLLRDRDVPAKLTIVGEGPLEAQLKAKAADLGLDDVELAGAVSHAGVLEAIARCHVYVMPSITDPGGETEGLGMGLLEALLVGRPVVACATGGIPDIVLDGQTGFLVPESDPAALAAALQRLHDDPDIGARLVERGRAHVRESFTPEATVRAYEDAYRFARERSRRS